jgi:outer membrane protein assembly factor BamB
MVNALTSKFFSLGIVVLLLCGVFWVCELPVTAAYGGDPDQWKYELLAETNYAGVSTWNNYLFYGDYAGNVTCFNSVDNSLVWTKNFGDEILCTPQVSNGSLCFTVPYQYLVVNPLNGDLIYNYTDVVSGNYPDGATPFIIDKYLIISQRTSLYYYGAVHAIDTTNDLSGFSSSTTCRIYNGVVGSDSQVFWAFYGAAGVQSQLLDGNWSIAWNNLNITDAIGLAYYDGVVYCGRGSVSGGNPGAVTALNASDGSELWTFPIDAGVLAYSYFRPSFYDGKVLFGTELGVYCLDSSNGSELWSISTSDYTRGEIAVYDNIGFVGVLINNMVAFNVSDGSEIWSFKIPDQYGYPSIYTNSAPLWSVASENFYFICGDYLYGFDYLLGPKTYSLNLIGDMQELYFYDDFESGADKWTNSDTWSSSEIQDTEVYNGQYSLYVSHTDEPYTLPFTSAISNFTFEIAIKYIDSEDIWFYLSDAATSFYSLDLTYYSSENYFYFWLDNYYFGNYLGIIDDEWVLSDDDSVFTTSLDSYLAEWLNFTFVFVPDDTTYTVSLYIDDVFVDTVFIDNELLGTQYLWLLEDFYVDDISFYGPVETSKNVGIWEPTITYFSTDPDFTGWLVNGEFVSSDRIYTLDVVSSFVTLEARSSSGGASVSPSPYVLPTSSVDFWFHASTVTFAGDSGYGALVSLPNVAASVSVSASGSVSASWGVRAWVVFDDRSVELTGGVPVSLGSISGVDSGLLSYSLGFPSVLLSFNDCVFKVVVYNRFEGDWSASAVFLSEPLAYRYLVGGPVVFNVFAERFEDGGNTYAVTRWGNSVYASGFSGVLFKTSTGTDWQNYYLGTGNFLMFLASPYTFMIGNLFYGLVLLGVGLSVYFRYRNISTVLIFITVLASAGGVGNILFGDAFAGVVWLVAAFALGLAYWRVFR